MNVSEMTCPFCGEGGFDGPGLKFHYIRGWCDEFNKIDTLTAPYRERPTPARKALDELHQMDQELNK